MLSRFRKALSVNRAAIGAMSILSVATLATAGLGFIIQVILARGLGASQFGIFSSSLATVTVVSPLAGFGISMLWLAVYGSEGAKASRWLEPSIRFIGVSVALVIALINIWAWGGPNNQETSLVITALSLYAVCIALNGLVSAKCQLEARYFKLAIWQSLPNFLVFTCVIASSVTGRLQMLGPLGVAKIYVVISLLLISYAMYEITKMMRGHFLLAGHAGAEVSHDEGVPSVLTVMRRAWKFGVAGLLYLVYYQSSIVLINYIEGPSSAGLYSVAYVVIGAMYMIPGVLYQKYFLPKIHIWASQDRQRLKAFFKKCNSFMGWLGLLLAALVILLSEQIVRQVFGVQYLQSIALISILAMAIPLRFCSSGAGALLNSGGYITAKVKVMAAAAAANIFLNAVLIPIYGAPGAAIATVVTELIVFLLFSYQVKFKLFRGVLDV